jgi:hypothetical protein
MKTKEWRRNGTGLDSAVIQMITTLLKTLTYSLGLANVKIFSKHNLHKT